MIIRGTPTDRENYVLIDFETAKKLHKNGIMPMFMDKDGMWFQKNEIEERGGEFVGE